MLALALVFVPAGCRDEGTAKDPLSEDGPLQTPDAHASIVRGATGTVITDGFDVLYLEGTENATIVSVESVGGTATLKFLGGKVAGPSRKQGGWSQLPGYPPQLDDLGELVDIEGAVIKPRAETRRGIAYELLLGYEVLDDAEVDWRSEIKVTYRVGGRDYVYTSPAFLVYCPESRTDEHCLSEAGFG